MTSQEDLEMLYLNVCNDLDKKIIKVFHLNSVQNFINYFNQLEEKDRLEVSVKIQEYLEIINSIKKTGNFQDIDSFLLFTNYVNPIGIIYQKRLDFGVVIIMWTRIVHIIIIAGVCWIINSFIFTIIVLLVLFWYGRRQYKRKLIGKFYQEYY